MDPQNTTSPQLINQPTRLPLIPLLIVGLILILVSAAGGYYLGVTRSTKISPQPTVVPTMPQGKACTMEALICPDGSSVGRTGPNCEFAPCPTQANTNRKEKFCGGFAGIKCPVGYLCKYDGNYPDASGVCVKK